MHCPYSTIRLMSALILATFVSSCNHVVQIRSSRPDAPTQALSDYGRGHHPVSAPAESSKPNVTEEAYQSQIAQLVAQEDFPQLEKIAQANRKDSDRLLGGAWKNFIFFQATGATDDNLQDSDYERAIAGTRKWISAYPNSAAAQISLALVYMNYASFARGTDYADAVSDAQWKLFNERLVLARAALLEASRLKERDPRWFEAMQELAFDEGWNKEQATALLEDAINFEPEYFHYYRAYANYLRPEWYGQEGDIEAFAKDVAGRFPEPKGSILYFRIDSSLACYCTPKFDELSGASWPKLKEGYNNLQRLYGTSNINANRFAVMAYRFEDQTAARDAFDSIAKMEPDIWMADQYFERARAWASPSDGFSGGNALLSH